VSHIGGHKYAGNVIVYRNTGSTSFGDWYGYVNVKDVSRLLESSIVKGEIVQDLYRGRTGVSAKISSKIVMKEGGSNIKYSAEDDA